MPDLTTNYSFKKPLATEVVDIAILNENFDDIDSKIKELDDENCKKTTGDLTITINSEADYDAMIVLMNSIAENNYAIEISAGSTYVPTFNKDLKISNIGGSGTISFPVTWQIVAVELIDITNKITFSAISVRKTSDSVDGFKLKNCPDVYFSILNCGIPVTGAFSTQSDTRIRLENSVLKVNQFSMTGNFTWTVNPYYFMYIDSKSRFSVTSGGFCSITCNSAPLSPSPRQFAVIKVEKGGYFEEKITPTFTNWNNNFVCQIYAEEYDFDYDVLAVANSAADALIIEDLLAVISKINSTLTIDLGDFRSGDIDIENIDGAGSLEIDKIQITASELFLANNINCNLYLSNVEITDGDPLGGLSLSGCRYFELIGDVISTITNAANRAMTFQNSRGIVEGYQPSASTTQINAINHILITEKSDVTFEDVDTTVYNNPIGVAYIVKYSKVTFNKCTKPADPAYVTIVLDDPGVVVVARDIALDFALYMQGDGVVAGNVQRIY